MTDRPVRITTLVDSLLAGGAERVAVELACGLDRERFDPHVLVSRGDGPLRSLLERADVPFTFLERRSRVDLAPWRAAHRHLRRDADLLHAHKFGSNAWGALLARTAGVPLVAHEHNFSETPSRLRSALSRRWVAPRAHRVLCVSDSVADVERASGVPDAKLQVVPNGVRLDAAWDPLRARVELGIEAIDGFVVGIVGRLRTEKAHEVLLSALARLRERDVNVHVCVVGDGPRMQELRALAAELDVAEHVTWAGERDDAARLASAFDAAVICSHWEGLPLAALEAMAAGAPLVASAVGGLTPLLSDGAGILVPPADPSALAAALEHLATDGADAAHIAARGRARIRERYSFESMVRAVEGIYLDALGMTTEPARTTTEHAA